MADELVPPRRIDKGIKRGPRKRPGQPPSSPRRKNGQYLPKLSNSPEDIRQALLDYSKGATLQQIADRHGVGRDAVYGWLLGGLGDQQHSEIVTQALTARIARADEVLESSPDPINVTRGRELARFARMDLERRRPHLYGIRQEVTVNHTVTIPVIDVSNLLDKVRGIKDIRTSGIMSNDLGGGSNPVEEKDSPPIEATPSSLLSSDSE